MAAAHHSFSRSQRPSRRRKAFRLSRRTTLLQRLSKQQAWQPAQREFQVAGLFYCLLRSISMPWKVRSSFINCAAILFRTVLLSAAVVQLAAVDNARWGANYFPNVILTTQDGARVRFYDDVIKGKIVVIDLIYTHCVDSCPLETARLAQVQRLLGDRVGKDIFFISISIDPTRD